MSCKSRVVKKKSTGIDVTLVTSRGSCTFWDDLVERGQFEGFVIDCRKNGWPIWFTPECVYVFMTEGRS